MNWADLAMVKLPGAASAIVDKAKIVDYLLNSDHLIGRAKSRFLESYGFRTTEWVVLKAAILAHAETHECADISQTAYGRSFSIDGPMKAPDGRHPTVRVVWFIREGEEIPRLVTLFPSRKERA
jgi:hypothetical protein